MNTEREISVRRSQGAIHFALDGDEFLEIRRGGDCIIRSVSPDGCNHTHTQCHPELLQTLLEGPAKAFAVGVEAIPVAIAEHFVIPTVIVFLPSADSGHRILMAREPLGIPQMNLLRDHLGPFLGVLNGDRFYVPKGAKVS